MRYAKLTFEYIKHNFLYLFGFAFVPAVALGVLTEPVSTFNFLVNYDKNAGFTDIFGKVSELHWISILVALAVVPIMLMFISAMCGIASKHMRLGVRDFHKMFRRVNNNIMYVFVIAVALILVLELNALFFVSFALLWGKIIASVRLAQAACIVTAILLWILMFWIISVCALWLPTMTVTGLNPVKALGEAFRLSRGKMFKIFVTIVLPIIPAYGIMAVLAAFDVDFRWIFNVFANWILIVYYVVMMYVTYYDICDVDREDKRNYDFIKNGVGSDSDGGEE